MIIKASVVDGAAVTAPDCLIEGGLLGAYSFSLPLNDSRMHCWIWSLLDNLLLGGPSVLEFCVSAETISLGLSWREGDLFESA
jgi:hypothetical protein